MHDPRDLNPSSEPRPPEPDPVLAAITGVVSHPPHPNAWVDQVYAEELTEPEATDNSPTSGILNMDDRTKAQWIEFASSRLGVSFPPKWNKQQIFDAIVRYAEAGAIAPPEPAYEPASPRG